MIEFTLSRAVLCACAVTILGAAIGYGIAYLDGTESDMTDDLADSVADLLDRFQESVLYELTLVGTDLIPDEGQVVTVENGVVTVTHGDKVSRAWTSYEGSFTLERSGQVTLTKDLGSRTSPRCA
ncbi:MAG: hypothetical protein Q4Q58_01935 [Thermoplasmata archaeon]|nr:hypothetical protein [Thermoplasmata archaeon]